MERHPWRPAAILVEKGLVEKEIVACDPAKLSNKSRGIVKTMITKIGSGRADAETKRRYQNALHHISITASFREPLSP